MGMRTDCRHYESRSYASGETVRKCRIDLAPEAPWKCPENCVGFERRLVDVGWHYGTLVDAQAPEPPPAVLSDDAAALLDAAEDIVNAVGPDILAEFERKQRRGRKRFRRKK
jgi:hypothetical protein